MSLTLRRLGAGFAALTLAGGAVLAASLGAHASTTPPWEPDPNSVGGLLFFNASGDPVTGGNINDSLPAYIEGTKTIRAGDTAASLVGKTPKNGVAPGSWQGESLAGPSTYPNQSAPAAVSKTLPVLTTKPGDYLIAYLTEDYPNTDTSTDGYAGLYQLRLETTKANSAANTTYDSADILVTGTGASATWSVYYDNLQQVTTTSLAVSPSTSAYHGSTVTLTATVTPSTAAGSVTFLDGSTVIKTVPVVAGKASTSTSTLSDATHKLKATFTPTSSAAFSTSSSTVKSITIKAHATSVKLKASKSSITKGKTVKLTATETPGVAGKIGFYDGSKKLATVTVKSGKATYSTKKLKVGTHKLTAKFAPSNTANDSASTSKVVKVKVKK